MPPFRIRFLEFESESALASAARHKIRIGLRLVWLRAPPGGAGPVRAARAGRGVLLLPDAEAASAAAAGAVRRPVPAAAVHPHAGDADAVDADGEVPGEHAEAAGVRGRAERAGARGGRRQGQRHLLPAAVRRRLPRRRPPCHPPNLAQQVVEIDEKRKKRKR